MMVPVRFLRCHLSYGVGELAGFAQGEARRLIERGIAAHAEVETPAEVEADAAPVEVKPAPRRRGRPRKS